MMPSQTNYQSAFGPVASFQQLANSGNAAAVAAAAAAAASMAVNGQLNGQLRSFSSCASHSNCPSASTSTTSSGVSTASYNSNSCHHFGAGGVPFTLSATSRTSPPVDEVAAASAASNGFASASGAHAHCAPPAAGGRMATSLYKPHEPYFKQSNSAAAAVAPAASQALAAAAPAASQSSSAPASAIRTGRSATARSASSGAPYPTRSPPHSSHSLFL